MADESIPPSGERFSDDLRAIREDRGVSIDDVHVETRIARTLIESFEKGQLYNHPNYNRVYLRSFVRAYAEAIGIESDVALESLEAALEGEYQDALIEKYSSAPLREGDADEGEPADPSGEADTEAVPGESDPSAAIGPEDRGGIVGPPRVAGEEASDEEGSPSPDRASEDPSVQQSAAQEDDETTARPADSEEARPSKEDETREDASEDGDHPSWLEEEEDVSTASSSEQEAPDPAVSGEGPPVGEVGGTGIVGEPTALGEEDGGTEAAGSSPSSRTTAPPRRSRSTSSWSSGIRNYSRELILAGIGLTIGLIVIVGLSWIYSTENQIQSTAEATEQPAGPDTASTGPSDTSTTTSPAPQPVDLTLGETLHLTIFATSNVRNIRIRRDNDLRRPYWIQEGEAEVYPFQRRVILQNELDDIQLYLEGYSYPMPADDTIGGFEITRSEAEAFTDTLRGEPPSLSVSPDTIPVGSPFNIP